MPILMCEPKYYGIFYEINPWMSMQTPAITNKAQQQWHALHQTLQSLQVDVRCVTPEAGLPDMVFTANAGLVHANNVLIAHFRAKERQGESAHFATWFEQAGFNVTMLNADDPTFEGAGDALWMGDILVSAFGFRSQKEVYKHAFFDPFNLLFCELVDPYFYHLDTCFCPLTDNLALWYPPAFSKESQHRLATHFELIAVHEAEAKRFACNAVVVDKHIILPAGCAQLTQGLVDRHFTVLACEMSEFIKAGGACKCLTLRV